MIFRLSAALLLILTGAAPAYSCPLTLPAMTIDVNGVELTAELAMTPSERACGLSRRFRLSENAGMLFVFPRAQPLSFWMKETHIPLSIAFMDAEGRIMDIYEMTPERTDLRYKSSGPALYALEVNAGWFQRHDLGVGDVIELNIPAVFQVK